MNDNSDFYTQEDYDKMQDEAIEYVQKKVGREDFTGDEWNYWIRIMQEEVEE